MRAVLLLVTLVTVAHAALIYGVDPNNNVVRVDTANPTAFVTVANTTWSGMPTDGMSAVLDPPPSGIGGGRYYISPYTGAQGNYANCVQKVTPPPPPPHSADDTDADRWNPDHIDAAGRDDPADTVDQAQMLCLGHGLESAIWSLAVDPVTHNLYLLTATGVVQVTPAQFAANTSTLIMSPPPPGLVMPQLVDQFWVASVWDPVNQLIWYAQGANNEYPMPGYPNSTFIGVKPPSSGSGSSATIVGPLIGMISRSKVVNAYWNAGANEFAAVVSDGHYGPTDCGMVRFTIDMNKLTLTSTLVFEQSGSYEDCASSGIWTGADGPTPHGSVWTLWNDDWYEWAMYEQDMSAQNVQENPTNQYPLPTQYSFPIVAMQPIN